MKTSASSSPDKEKLSNFFKDCLMMGCLKGFYFFELYSRGREELLITIKIVSENMLGFSSNFNQSFSYKEFSTIQDDIPPSSPSTTDAETMAHDVVFLIGGYVRYKRPFVWLRSNNAKLLALRGKQHLNNNKDTPLELKTTSAWKMENTNLWEIIEELINCTLQLTPKNPFKIDFTKIESMPIFERAMNSIALVNFLRKIYLNKPFSEDVFQDIQKLLDIHYFCLPYLLTGYS